MKLTVFESTEKCVRLILYRLFKLEERIGIDYEYIKT